MRARCGVRLLHEEFKSEFTDNARTVDLDILSCAFCVVAPDAPATIPDRTTRTVAITSSAHHAASVDSIPLRCVSRCRCAFQRVVRRRLLPRHAVLHLTTRDLMTVYSIVTRAMLTRSRTVNVSASVCNIYV